MAELAKTAADLDYLGMDEQARVAFLLQELSTARPLVSPFLTCSSAQVSSELDIVRAAADIHRRYGKDAVPNYVISKANAVSDILEVAVLLKEVGLVRPTELKLDVNIVPLFETIEDLQNCTQVIDALFSIPPYMTLLKEPRQRPRDHARLF